MRTPPQIFSSFLIMKKLLSLLMLVFVLTLALTLPSLVWAAEMHDDHTAREEAEGKEMWGKLKNKETNCENLNNENFEAMGEYFMKQMVGDSHQAMNHMIVEKMGEESEEEVHVAMGKRMSECDPNAVLPQNNNSIMDMMSSFSGSTAATVAPWGGLLMIAVWSLAIVGVISLVKWAVRKK